MSKVSKRRRSVLALLAAGAAGAHALAQAAPEAPAEWQIAAGYGASVHLNRGHSVEHLAVVEPQFGYRLGRHFEYVAEGHLAGYFTPHGYMLGLMPLGARYYPVKGEVMPYLSLGAGFGWTDLTQLEEINRRFNFLLQASLGLRKNLSLGRALGLELRLAHISNAGTVRPTLGLNSLIVLGSWRIR